MKYTISFCVPVYNKIELTKKIVDEILSCERKDIQVVISDNNSTDNTLEVLRQYNDSRLKVCTNSIVGYNPALANWYNALENGDGKFLYLVMSRDQLHAKSIDKLVDVCISAGDKVAVLYDLYGSKPFDDVLENRYFFMKTKHPTGYVFRRDYYRTVKMRKTIFTKFQYSFPEIMITALLLEKFEAKRVSTGFFRYKFLIDYKNTKSTFGEIYFSPEQRIKQCVIFAMFYKRYCREEIFYILERLYGNSLNEVARFYKETMANKNIVYHYGLETREVSELEQTKNCIKLMFIYCGMIIKSKVSYKEYVHMLKIIGKTQEYIVKNMLGINCMH